MVSPRGEVATHGEPPDALEVSHDAFVERLQRRVAALERQLEARIAQVGDLQGRMADQEVRLQAAGAEAAAARADAAAARHEADVVRHKAAEYEALMHTITMRALRRPREWYAAARRRFAPKQA